MIPLIMLQIPLTRVRLNMHRVLALGLDFGERTVHHQLPVRLLCQTSKTTYADLKLPASLTASITLSGKLDW